MMNKLVSFLGLRSTGPRNYPELDSYHSHCTVSIHFNDITCQSAYNLNKDDIETWHPDHSGVGVYELYDAVEEEQIWTARHSKSDQIDDVMFQYYPDTGDFRDAGCTVGAKS